MPTVKNNRVAVFADSNQSSIIICENSAKLNRKTFAEINSDCSPSSRHQTHKQDQVSVY